MKTKALFLLALAALFLIQGCGESREAVPTGTTVEDILKNAGQAQLDALKKGEKPPGEEGSRKAEAPPEEEFVYDEDLTADKGMMLYSRAYNFITNPDAHKGRRVKMEGYFTVYNINGEFIFICKVTDPISCSCCAPSVEFEFSLGKDKKFPDDYPARDAHMIIDGTYAPYYTNDYLIPFFENVKILKAD